MNANQSPLGQIQSHGLKKHAKQVVIRSWKGEDVVQTFFPVKRDPKFFEEKVLRKSFMAFSNRVLRS